MGKCKRCGSRFLGDRRFCPKCKTDIWYDEYAESGRSFRELQKEGRRLLERGSLAKSALVLDVALDEVMYQKAEYGMKELMDAVSDRVMLFTEQKGREGEENMEEVLEFAEDACRKRDPHYEDEIAMLRSEAALYMPENAARKAAEIDYPEKRESWKLALPAALAEAGEEAGYEPEISRQKHLTLTECFLYLFQNCDAVVRFLQSQEALSEAIVYERVLPLIHTDLDAQAAGGNRIQARFGNIFCSLLEEGFGRLAGIYMDPRPVDELEERLVPLIERCTQIGQETGEDCPEVVAMAAVAPLLAGRDTAAPVFAAGEPVFAALWADFDRLQKVLKGFDTLEAINEYRTKLSCLFAEYSAVFGATEYLSALALSEDDESYLDAMELAAGNGIARAAEELARCHFYGYRGLPVSPGYAKFYTQMLSIREIDSSIISAVESIPDLEMLVPGTDE